MGLLSHLVWARLQIATDLEVDDECESEGADTPMYPGEDDGTSSIGQKDASAFAGNCLGIAYLGFASRPAAEKACKLVKEV